MPEAVAARKSRTDLPTGLCCLEKGMLGVFREHKGHEVAGL